MLPVGLVSFVSGVPLETLTVYQTTEHPDLEKNLKNYFTEQVIMSHHEQSFTINAKEYTKSRTCKHNTFTVVRQKNVLK